MSPANTAIKDVLAASEPVSDGRRARSEASRSKIVQAAMELIAAGDMNPSTAKIAKHAGVGLRSVFRHFEDKDAIFREMDARLTRAYRPLIRAPFKSDAWRDRLVELIERRCEVSEAIAPYRIATTSAGRFSKFLKPNYRKLHETEKGQLNAILPGDMHTDTDAGRAIMVAMSFETWRLLRHDEDLSARQTVAAVKRLVEDIVARHAD